MIYCSMANQNTYTTVYDRFIQNVEVDENGCWIWRGTILRSGYAQTRVLNKGILAHRLSYETYIGPIPKDLVIDHLCRVRACVNPFHLEAVTVSENNRRMMKFRSQSITHCRNGHNYSEPNNLRFDKKGKRYCGECNRIRKKRAV